jgi:transcriptional regulator with XRE-family HTH domain
MNIKERVEKEIKKGVSRRKLAQLVGVSLGTVQNVLLGDTEIKNSTIDKFSRYFGTRLDAIPQAAAENWKDKYISCMEELHETRKELDELRRKVDRLTAPLGSVVKSDAS